MQLNLFFALLFVFLVHAQNTSSRSVALIPSGGPHLSSTTFTTFPTAAPVTSASTPDRLTGTTVSTTTTTNPSPPATARTTTTTGTTPSAAASNTPAGTSSAQTLAATTPFLSVFAALAVLAAAFPLYLY